MSRDSNGNYDLPIGNPVTSGTVIEASWANSTMTDIGTALTDSLSRTGSGGMLAPFQNDSGTVSAPGITWTQDTTSGWRWETGPFIYGVVSQTDVVRMTINGIDIWNGTGWAAVLYEGGPGTVADGTINGSIMRWDETTDQAWEETNALTVSDAGDVVIGNRDLRPDGTAAAPSSSFNADTDTGFYRKADNQLGFATAGLEALVIDENQNLLPTSLIDGRDVAADGTQLDTNTANIATNTTNISTVTGDLATHEADTDIHFPDALANGSPYSRQDNGWVLAAAGIADTADTDGQVRVAGGWVDGLQVLNTAGAAQAQPTDVQALTQGEYDVLGGGVDANTLYFIT